MDSEALRSYKQQLDQVNHALIICSNEDERNELQSLKNTIEELLSLSNEGSNEPSTSNDRMEDEFALFMAEMENEGVVERKNLNENICKVKIPKDIEGKKCRAPHRHQWGDVAYHNAMVCSVIPDDDDSDFKVRVLFTNPTHQEMLPCPYFFDSDCKFSEEKCRFSHGEIVPYSSLQEYIEPKFELLKVGSVVLTKQLSNIWRRAKIKQIYEDKCLVRLESDKKQIEVNFEHVLPLDNDRELDEESSDSEAENDDTEEADIINNSLMVTPCDNKLGDWEKYTKGVGSRLMNKMGYIVGTGLGKNADGRIDPISAVVLPAGKSLDHCMKLREESGGDKDLFSVERKLQRLQKKQEKQNQRIYEQQAKNHDVFNFINKTLDRNGAENEVKNKLQERQKIKQECSRNLNIRSLKIAEDIRKTEKDLEKLKDSLGRHDASSNVYIKLKDKLMGKQDQLKVFQSQALVIRNEQNLRNDKKKMTVF